MLRTCRGSLATCYSSQSSALFLFASRSYSTPDNSSIDALTGQSDAPKEPAKNKGQVAKPKEDRWQTTRKHDNLKFSKVEATQAEASLDDLDVLRPSRLPSTRSPDYPEVYRKTMTSLNRAFTLEQLNAFITQIGLKKTGAMPRGKMVAIQLILNLHWSMDTPVDGTSKRRVSQKIPITADQLFLLLAREGSQRQEAELKFGVQIEPCSIPLSLAVTGPNKGIQELTKYLNNLKRSSHTTTINPLVPNAIDSSLLQPLSRLSRTFFQNEKSGKVVVTAASRSQIQTAHRMVNRVCFEKSRPHRVPLLVGAVAGPKSTTGSSDGPYALFPFVSAGPSPWTMGDANTQRIRKVGGWSPLAESDRQSPNQSIIGFQSPSGVVDLKETLLSGPSRHEIYQRRISARTGHVLLPTSGKGIFASSFGKSPDVKSLFEKSVEGRDRLFIEGAPPSSGALPSTSPSVLRLTYRTLSPNPQDGRSKQEMLVAELTLNGVETSMKCFAGFETIVDVAIPDSPLDLSFANTETLVLSDMEIPKLLKTLPAALSKESATTLPSRPLPDYIQRGSTMLYLDTVGTVTKAQHVYIDRYTLEQISYTTETTVDVDSQIQTTCCLTECPDSSDASWQRFLQDSYAIASRPYYRPQATLDHFVSMPEVDA